MPGTPSSRSAAHALAPFLELVPEQGMNGIVHSVQPVRQAVARAGLAEALPR
jgi:hypothetical protein